LAGKSARRMSGGGIPEECRQRPNLLEAFKKEIERRKRSRWRTNRVALFPNRYEGKVLFDIGLACARLWNELSYEKMYSFFNRELSPGKRDEINKRYYHKYRGMLGVYAGQVINRLLIRMMRLGTLSSSY